MEITLFYDSLDSVMELSIQIRHLCIESVSRSLFQRNAVLLSGTFHANMLFFLFWRGFPLSRWHACQDEFWQKNDHSPIYAPRICSTGKAFKDRAHLSTFKIFIFEKFSCFIILVVFLVIVQSSELVSVWFCEKMNFFPIFFSYHIFAIYVGGASLGLPTACRLIADSGARLPSVDVLVVRCIKMHHHVKSAITICLQFI